MSHRERIGKLWSGFGGRDGREGFLRCSFGKSVICFHIFKPRRAQSFFINHEGHEGHEGFSFRLVFSAGTGSKVNFVGESWLRPPGQYRLDK